MRKSRFALFRSVISLVLCFSMLAGTTFAWLTDGVTTKNNMIASGSLDVELEYLDSNGDWKPVGENTEVLDKNALWEPGYTEVAYLRISNTGNLALNYAFGVGILSETGSVNADGEAFKLSDYIKFGVLETDTQVKYDDRDDARDALTQTQFVRQGYTARGQEMLLSKGVKYVTLVVYMPEDVGNAANYAIGANLPEIKLGIQLVATQAGHEADSFGYEYDMSADLPPFSFADMTFADNASAGVTTDGQNKLAEDVNIQGNQSSAAIPAGVLLDEGVETLTLEITSMARSEANIALNENEAIRSLDVHVTGVSATNNKPMEIMVNAAAVKGLNDGNLKLYHVENGATIEMSLVDLDAEFTAHNQFKYDPATGNIILYLATFSEVALIANEVNAWNGTIATGFAGGDGTAENPYLIANADQLAYLGDRISNDNGNYAYKNYKLIANVNIGGAANYNDNGVIWYPIGYNKIGGNIATINMDEVPTALYFGEAIPAAASENGNGGVWYTYGGSFKGVFDGNNHVVSGIYQNTWAMKGNYDGHYYKEAMGLFGYVNGGVIKNLIVDNFYSEGEFAPTGCVTAYAGGNATFENIAIKRSHPQTYNTGVAGVVGWDNGNSTNFTFKNITVDSTNTISALWGSWDVAAAGILGSLKEGSKVSFENCHVSATMDVYNDVCGNYQYYWYRYCGAFIGTVYKRLNGGKGALDLSDVTAKNCTVNFGERHEYYYCEFEKNSQASYTDDYQFSRVNHSELNMNDIPVSCNHTHTANEDKQAVYLPFYQLFGGYGWGVQGIDLETYNNLDITADKKGIAESETEKSVTKFMAAVAANTEFESKSSVKIGELFNAVENVSPAINSSNVQVTISPVGDNSTAGGTYEADSENWANGTLTFTGEGEAEIIISDYNYCEPTSLKVTVRTLERKFEAKAIEPVETDSTVMLGELFAAVDGANINSAMVEVTIDGEKVDYVKDDADWTKKEIQFISSGSVKVSITDKNFCITESVDVTVKDRDDKFDNNDSAPKYILVNDGTIKLGELFNVIDGVEINVQKLTINVSEGAEYVYTPDETDWSKGTLKFMTEGEIEVTITDNTFCNECSATINVIKPVKKFTEQVNAPQEFLTDSELKIGDLFAEITNVTPEIDTKNIQVAITPVGDDNKVSGNYTPDKTDWTNGTLTVSGVGAAKISITDGYFCEETILDVMVTEPQPTEKFASKFSNKYLYRVGNMNTVALGSLFEAKDGVKIANVSVTIENVNGNAAGVYTANENDWTKSTIQFSGTGKIKVTISDDYYCRSLELELEVVNAVNATSATNAKSNNVVLLNDVGLSTIEVSGGHTLYGNGFKMTATSDPMYDTMRAGFVTLDNGTLDNVQIICPNFSFAIIYNSQIKDKENTAVPSDSTNDARGNVRSAVMATGNSKIINSYVHGGRAAIFLRAGNLLVEGSTISGGAAANIHALSAQSLTLRNATLIQKPFRATIHDTSKTLMGFSGLFECGEDGYSTPLILEGTLVQNAWINEGYVNYTPSEASSIVENALKKTEYLHDLDGDGTKESLNLGFTYIPQSSGGSTYANVTDNRTTKETVPYAAIDVGSVLASAKVYSYKNTSGTVGDFKVEVEYSPSTQGTTTPTVSFTDTNADRVFETNFDANDGRWESSLTVNLDKGNYTFSFDKLLVQKNGANLSYTVKKADETEVDTSEAILLANSGMTEYVLTVTDDKVTHTIYFILTASKTSISDPVVADTTGGTPLLVVKSKNSDWSCALPALEGIKVKYYTVDGEVILDLATLTPTSVGKKNGTNNYWETTKDGYKLKVTCGVIHDTKSVYGMPVVVDNKGTKQMYFTISSTNGYVSTGTAARSVTLTYEFTDPNGKTLTFPMSYNVNRSDYINNGAKQYSYDDFVNGTLKEASSSCVAPETLITLADGSLVRIDSLIGNEELLVWNHETGKYDVAPVAYIVNHDEAVEEHEITHLYFSDGSEVRVINEHVFYDVTLNKYIALTGENYEDYIGHKFAAVKDDNRKLKTVKLEKVEQYVEETSAYEVVSYKHLTCFTNNILSTSAYLDKLLNVFDINPVTKAYSAKKVAKDIETYGLYTYDDFKDLISEEAFEMYNAAYLKVAVGKGYITWDDILALIDIYFNVDVQPIQ